MKFLDSAIRYGTLLFVFLVPWQARLIVSEGAISGNYWEYGTQSLYATEILLLGVLLALIAKGISHYKKHKPRFYAHRLLTMPGRLFVFLVWVGISIVWSIDREAALEHWIVLVEASAVFLVLASGAIQFRALSWAVILSGVIQAAAAFIQFRFSWLPASSFFGMAYQHASILGASVVETDMARWLRGYGSFPHPNILGGWLALGLLLAVKEAVRRGRSAASTLSYIPIAIMSVGLAVTFSRSAWLAFGVGIAVLIVGVIARSVATKQSREQRNSDGITSPPFRRLAMTLGVMLLFVGTLVWSYPEPFNERVFGSGRLETKSSEERSGGISEALQLIQKHPFMGVGVGNYGLAVHRDIDNSQPAYYYQPVHNVLLLVLAELGVIGLILMIWLAVSLRGAIAPKQSYQSMAAGLSVLLPITVLAFFDHYVWSLYAGVMIGAVYVGIFYLKLAKN